MRGRIPRWWAGAGLLALLSLGCILAARWTGQHLLARPAAVRALASQPCGSPCWRGIQPGRTQLTDPLPTTDEYQVTTYADPGQAITRLHLYPTGELLLGDLIVAWGPPSHVRTLYALQFDGNVGVHVQLYFQEGLVMVRAVEPHTRHPVDWVAPHMPVIELAYYAPSPESGVIEIGTPRWRGFGQLYPPE